MADDILSQEEVDALLRGVSGETANCRGTNSATEAAAAASFAPSLFGLA